MKHILILVFPVVIFVSGLLNAAALEPSDYRVEYGADNAGPHIVFVAGEREYRSEESLPALARILAKRHGFRCTVLFTLAEDGTIEPQTSNLRGLDVLDDADLMFLFMRFLDLPHDEMAHFVRYLDSGKPIIGLRTSTHAFRIADGPYRKYDATYEGDDYFNGFGRQVLGETWVAHHGDNHLHSTRLDPIPAMQDHPVLRGVNPMHVVTGGYTTDPAEGSVPLVMAQPLDGMRAGSPDFKAFEPVPAVWTRVRDVGERGRVLTCTHGASRDLLDAGLRRLLVNACFWAAGLEDRITSVLDIEFVGSFEPTEFGSWAWKRGVRPADLAGYSSLIMPGESTEAPPAFQKRLEAKRRKWEEAAATAKFLIIDTHTHFKGEEQIAYETKGKKPHPKNTLGQVVRAEDYRPIAKRLGIQATVVVEAIDQDRPDFNDWIFEQAAKSNVICGYVARDDLSSPDFEERYERYRKTGFLNGYRFRREELTGYLDDETARRNIARLAKDGVVADLLLTMAQRDDVLRLARDFPELKIVVNHCFNARMVDGKIGDDWVAAVRAFGKYPNVHMKISSILNFAGTRPFEERAPADLEFYRPVMDVCYDAFGEDRVIFGTNWGVSAHFGPVDDVPRIVREFLEEKGEAAVRKGMRENALRVYGVKKLQGRQSGGLR